MTFADHVLQFHRRLSPNWEVPQGVTVLYPFDQEATWQVMEAFFKKYFEDHNERHLIFGINPGRFGAGITGTPFTDPKMLEETCEIPNPFKKKHELSALFVYAFIQRYGTIAEFYQRFYITSLCPLGFVKNGKNYNYYDDKALQEAVEPHIIANLEAQIRFGGKQDVAFCMGRGKNYAYFKKLNDKQQFFQTIVPLPHPRWVMQYRRKSMEAFVEQFVAAFRQVTPS